ncbi:Lrp/AsnC family transcriptional regulator [Dehalobacterium formicoaceticum]|uniref:Lrp/AsnC family transcriptional regulator n=1 Tax=Dehalobacterium formicoaceticum TaxID=51515 RepID=A0ABT1Y796_9FIRM|nr:Lrp/AsnC family transcriptional regulator [Dehalobacterium formicoaceticum]MCR6546346.1 Lrp/AsnC family transcriptional regulator [Dehalobacterium formicoaceticum]
MRENMREKILKILESNGRIPFEQLAVMVDLSASEVEEIIRELEDEKIILKYSAVVNWEKAGLEESVAIIDVKVAPQREVGFDAVAQRIYRFPEVRSVSLISGDYDLSVSIEGKSMKEVASFVSQKLSSIDGVLGTSTHFILKRYKVAGVVYEDEYEDRRELVSP